MHYTLSFFSLNKQHCIVYTTFLHHCHCSSRQKTGKGQKKKLWDAELGCFQKSPQKPPISSFRSVCFATCLQIPKQMVGGNPSAPVQVFRGPSEGGPLTPCHPTGTRKTLDYGAQWGRSLQVLGGQFIVKVCAKRPHL